MAVAFTVQFLSVFVTIEETPPPESLTNYIEEVDVTEWSVKIINRTAPEPTGKMLGELFDGLDIDTTEVDVESVDDNVVVLLHDGEVVASSPLGLVRDTLLAVNSDLYKTSGEVVGNITPPKVITELSDTVFTLRAYPKSNSEKLVLTLVSRSIEYQARSGQSGTLRTSFQRLSRLDDESGTRTVYERLGRQSNLDVHVYGVPDWEPPESMGVTPHGVSDDEIMRHWFVVYRADETQGVAMLAVKTGPSEWRGFWTFQPGRIREINRYIARTF